MKPETDPITDDEWLLRRVRIERFRTNKTPFISPNAFEPRITGREPDTEGISLYRQACLQSPEDILATIDADKRKDYGIVRVPVSLFLSLKLTVQSSPDSQIVGHVVIPELNSTAYAADKASFTAVKFQLATVASEAANLVWYPASVTE